MARKRELERAKKRFLSETEHREWVQGVGIGRVGRKLGLLISVRPGTKSAASRVLNRLELDVPVTVRAVDNIRTRGSNRSSSETKQFEDLRSVALARIEKHE